jgi:hypothetical protein
VLDIRTVFSRVSEIANRMLPHDAMIMGFVDHSGHVARQAATNRDFRKAVERGIFREDLFYRLQVFDIPIAPLRERPEDILPLVFRRRRVAHRTSAPSPNDTLPRLQADAGGNGPGFHDDLPLQPGQMLRLTDPDAILHPRTHERREDRPDHVRAIFTAARVDQLEPHGDPSSGAERIDAWVAAFAGKIRQIEAQRCQSIERTDERVGSLMGWTAAYQ